MYLEQSPLHSALCRKSAHNDRTSNCMFIIFRLTLIGLELDNKDGQYQGFVRELEAEELFVMK